MLLLFCLLLLLVKGFLENYVDLCGRILPEKAKKKATNPSSSAVMATWFLLGDSVRTGSSVIVHSKYVLGKSIYTYIHTYVCIYCICGSGLSDTLLTYNSNLGYIASNHTK